MVPLLFLLGSRGRIGTGAWMEGPRGGVSASDPDDESERSILGIVAGVDWPSMIRALSVWCGPSPEFNLVDSCASIGRGLVVPTASVCSGRG